jgi:hypothetical protein
VKSQESESHPALTALDLANLAVRLDPIQCRSNPRAAFKNAVEFYQLACLWVDKHASQDPLRRLLDTSNEALVDEVLDAIGRKNLEAAATERLRFYPKSVSADDPVRCVLGIKTPRAVKDRFRKWHIGLCKRRGAKNFSETVCTNKFLRFWENARCRDKDGTEYYEFAPSIVYGVKSFHTEVKRRGGIRARQTASAAKQSRSKRRQKKKSAK